MKSTKTILVAALAAGALLAGNLAARAQDSTNTPPPGMHGHGPSPEQINKDLNLTDDQKPKVKAVMDEQMQKMRDLRQSDDFKSLSREDKMAKMKAIHEDAATKLKTILTPDQFAKWQKMGPGMRPPGGPKPPQS
jgi:Spy/CpxP family protein refolding chaperone